MTQANQSTPVTRVNPQGASRLYLRTDEIPHFFAAFGSYCEQIKNKSRKIFWISFFFYLFFSFLIMGWSADTFELFDDEEGVLVVLTFIGLVIGFFVMLGIFNSQKKKYQLLHARQKLLAGFFHTIREDLHPESGLKGSLDHGKYTQKDQYKQKTSPYSGSKKSYYKFTWAALKFTLADGNQVQLRCMDKLKEKGGSVIRFQEIEKGKILPNELLYQGTKKLIPLRKEIATTQEKLILSSELLAREMVVLFKNAYLNLEPRTQKDLRLAQTTSQQENIPPKATLLQNQANQIPSEAVQTLPSEPTPISTTRLTTFLNQSSIPGLNYTPLGKGGYRVTLKSNTEAANSLLISFLVIDGETFLRLTLPFELETPSFENLLKANPALAYGRFALYKEQAAQTPSLCLIKNLLYKTLDQEELDSALTGLIHQSNQLKEISDIPLKAKAMKSERETGWELSLLHDALFDLNAQIETKDKKFKIQIPVNQNRKQTVHLRFDRQDMSGRQLIAIQSFCGENNPNLHKLCLEENSKLAYGAIGIGKLGDKELFMVTDNQLADTAQALEIRSAVLQIAEKADSLESLLSDRDTY
ncbi:hypothetical protein COW36_09825 [bacterium (Candidatus Blackallbacteria) CG17_big_fil_post_rev_8_21_14_2_50_48_46]|uniref:Uncharacterized protein n=1 Tax=bacterium (Candidatus Blackallbacteria) CG17_big_fil_post_rev_8_21_14_2_50_48_46 TaxID=2014261 RepID=A0A2M7G5K9_9BACT|nr:MAG: hypothetical protein COW64_01585 [bacterium (Candidatus Blackallbacteria) CG18_big_fil_WC_8_21_14_2_50_49_26]PIW17258.1 MAG: hypothetical protein COW36_09825 [bacterium (Candidatus Blackallbacteria) CG17_big_fil_post_rev_8_21_14_2_50_48_46]